MTTKFRLVFTADTNLNGVDPTIIMGNMEGAIRDKVSGGHITGETAAELGDWTVGVVELKPWMVDFETIVERIRNKISYGTDVKERIRILSGLSAFGRYLHNGGGVVTGLANAAVESIIQCAGDQHAMHATMAAMITLIKTDYLGIFEPEGQTENRITRPRHMTVHIDKGAWRDLILDRMTRSSNQPNDQLGSLIKSLWPRGSRLTPMREDVLAAYESDLKEAYFASGSTEPFDLWAKDMAENPEGTLQVAAQAYMESKGIPVNQGKTLDETLAPTGEPNWDAIKDKRMSELTPEQRDDALEFWLRKNSGWFRDDAKDHIDFLLKRLDKVRASRVDPNDPTTREQYRKMFNTAVDDFVKIGKALGLEAQYTKADDFVKAIEKLVAITSQKPVAYAVYGIGGDGRHYLNGVKQIQNPTESWKSDDNGLGDRWSGNEGLIGIEPPPIAPKKSADGELIQKIKNDYLEKVGGRNALSHAVRRLMRSSTRFPTEESAVNFLMEKN